MKTCTQCQSPFEFTDADRQFYGKMSVPEPLNCPDCRNQKRMSWRNEKTLYKRNCDLCTKGIISIYSPNKPFPVYCQECFWSDKWNALDHGQEFDANQPFFEQFSQLINKVPRLAVINKQSENSEYCNYSFANKNCYLTFGNHYEEDSLYGRYSTKNRFCLDYLWTYNSELCYENTFSKNCYKSLYLDHCEGCQDCLFSKDIISCKHCLFCSNLQHREYCVLNQQYSKEEYSKKLGEWQLNTHQSFQKAIKFFVSEFPKKFPSRAIYNINCENCIGENLNNCKNTYQCFDCSNCEDIAHAVQIDETYDSMDMTCMGYDRSEVCYETIGCSGIFNCSFCDSCWMDSDLLYCNLCFSSKNCFGCVSLQHKEYCIFNKLYTKEQFEKIREQIIAHMKKSDEWGKFFPTKMSPYAYNETIAYEYYPMTKETVLRQGWQWRDVEDKMTDVKKVIPAKRLPDTITEIPDDVLNWAIECEKTGRPFKIQKQELEFYRKMSLPLPHYHPDIRFETRMQRRRPRNLYNRKCTQCQTAIQTTYAPDRPEKVYCEACYLKEVY